MKIKAISILFRTTSGKEYTEFLPQNYLEFESEALAHLYFGEQLEGKLAIPKWLSFPSLPWDADGVKFEDRNKVGQRDKVWSKNIESYSITLIQEQPKLKAV